MVGSGAPDGVMTGTGLPHPVTGARITGPVEVPEPVRRLADGGAVEPVWRNELGGLTFRLPPHRDQPERYVKWLPGPSEHLADEAARLLWAVAWTPVPRVLDHGQGDAGSWLVTAAVPGRSAVDPRWLAEPRTAARALGAGLRALHDALPVAACPFDWGVPARLAAADRRESTLAVPEEEERRRRAARAALPEPPPVDRPVVCHGDACAPNTLLAEDGRWTAHVDLGALGVGDPWADLAIAAWSTEWNYGQGYEDLVYEAYGLARDDERIDYYRRLWDAT